VQRLRTVPGVGPVTAAAFVATIDDAQRFHRAHGGTGEAPGLRGSDETAEPFDDVAGLLQMEEDHPGGARRPSDQWKGNAG
jgi:hypothetical protein